MNELTLTTPPPGLTAADYALIEQAVMETARGRWFMLEYARRQRAAETQRLADAVDRLEALIAGAPGAQPSVNSTAATVAERLSDIVWRMREAGFDDHLCAELERQISNVRRLRASDAVWIVETIELDAPAGLEAPLPEEMPQVEIASPQARDAQQASRPPPNLHSMPSAPGDPRLTALSHLDDLPLAERLALFC